jgi:hypothetical protein
MEPHGTHLQKRGLPQSCGAIGGAHELHVCINHGHGHVIFEVSRETRRVGVISRGDRHEIEAIRSLPGQRRARGLIPME